MTNSVHLQNIPDLSYIKNSMKAMINKLKVDQLIILESTSYPSTTENFIVKEINKKFEVGYKFFVGYSPEREDPGNHKFSIKKYSNQKVEFIITDHKSDIHIIYKGVLPNLFRESQGIVAKGLYNGLHFYAKSLLTKHDEN